MLLLHLLHHDVLLPMRANAVAALLSNLASQLFAGWPWATLASYIPAQSLPTILVVFFLMQHFTNHRSSACAEVARSAAGRASHSLCTEAYIHVQRGTATRVSMAWAYMSRTSMHVTYTRPSSIRVWSSLKKNPSHVADMDMRICFFRWGLCCQTSLEVLECDFKGYIGSLRRICAYPLRTAAGRSLRKSSLSALFMFLILRKCFA